jgi:hypothetical protein
MLQATKRFLEEEFLPHIEKRGNQKRPIHEAARPLSFNGMTHRREIVSARKYKDAGPFVQSLVSRDGRGMYSLSTLIHQWYSKPTANQKWYVSGNIRSLDC